MFSEMDNLAFQEFGDESPFTNASNDRRPPTNVKDSSNLVTGDIDLNDTPTTDQKAGPNIFSFKFYQQYFDVDQDQVQNRLLRALVPNVKSNFITDHIQPIPDLYGPLWICITFVFSTAICGNLAHYIETHGQDRYENDFGLVTGATSLVTTYVIFVPFFLYWALWYRKTSVQYNYFELLSAYGYSLAVFIPVSVLWVIHFHWFRWLLILAAISIGCLMLYNIVWPAVKDDPNKAVALAIVGGVLLLHTGLALTFKAYYFDSVIPSSHGSIPEPAELPKENTLIENPAAEVPKVPDVAAQVAGTLKNGTMTRRDLPTEAPAVNGLKPTENLEKKEASMPDPVSKSSQSVVTTNVEGNETSISNGENKEATAAEPAEKSPTAEATVVKDEKANNTTL